MSKCQRVPENLVFEISLKYAYTLTATNKIDNDKLSISFPKLEHWQSKDYKFINGKAPLPLFYLIKSDLLFVFVLSRIR